MRDCLGLKHGERSMKALVSVFPAASSSSSKPLRDLGIEDSDEDLGPANPGAPQPGYPVPETRRVRVTDTDDEQEQAEEPSGELVPGGAAPVAVPAEELEKVRRKELTEHEQTFVDDTFDEVRAIKHFPKYSIAHV